MIETIFHQDENGFITCARHPGSFDMDCGGCMVAMSAERDRSFRQAKARDLAIAYLKEGLDPEAAMTKATDAISKIYQIPVF